MDVVLFGPPKHHNYIKDALLVLSLVIAIGGCWFAYVQHKYSQTHLKRMMRDMESLSRAEEQLMELQNQLHQAKHEQEQVITEKQNLEQKLKNEIDKVSDAGTISLRDSSLTNMSDMNRIYELEEELKQVKDELKRAESAKLNQGWAPPQELQNWLQLTHELELKHYNSKRHSAEMQLAIAKEGVN